VEGAGQDGNDQRRAEGRKSPTTAILESLDRPEGKKERPLGKKTSVCGGRKGVSTAFEKNSESFAQRGGKQTQKETDGR